LKEERKKDRKKRGKRKAKGEQRREQEGNVDLASGWTRTREIYDFIVIADGLDGRMDLLENDGTFGWRPMQHHHHHHHTLSGSSKLYSTLQGGRDTKFLPFGWHGAA